MKTIAFQLPDPWMLGIQCAGVLTDGSAALPVPGAPVIGPVLADPPEIGDGDIRQALGSPVGSDSLFDIVRPGESLCIVVSDHTRKTAVDRVLPVLVNGLLERGCAVEDMFILIASGIHRHPSTSEVEQILGSASAGQFRGRIFLHDPDNSSELAVAGMTERGCRALVSRRALAADRLILTGSVAYHYHAGFGGGRKALVPGLAGRRTIAFTHSLTIDPVEDRIHPGVGPGRLDGNPVAEEMLECARLCGPDAIINTVLTPGGRIASVCAGELDAAHRAACGVARDVYSYSVPDQADLVIADAGSASNWIQSHKALFNADRAVHSNGRIVLVAPCPEGLGNERFRYWIRRKTFPEMFDGLRQSPEALGQTALSTKERGRKTILVTGMPESDIEDLGIRAAADLESAIKAAVSDLSGSGISRPRCYIMPQARYTVPFVGSVKDED